jgi:hypothetical protein
VAAPSRSRRDALAARRELLVATATLQRVRLALAVGLPLARLRARWHGLELLTQVARAWLAPRGTGRWMLWARLLVLLRRLLRRARPRD